MGVLRRKSRLLMTGYTTLDDYLIDYESDVEVESGNDIRGTTAQDVTPQRRRQKDGRNAKKVHWLEDLTSDLDMLKKKQMGTRKQRRYENARLLYSMADAGDICEDYSDILQSTVTALSKLFTEEENMQAWNTFTEKNEEEQREYLRNCEMVEMHKEVHCSCFESHSFHEVDNFEQRASDGCIIYSVQHKNSSCTSHTAEASFLRLNRRLRMILRHKTLPLEFMAVNEKEMRKFFHKNVLPVSEWSSSVLPRLQRLIIHALSQYLSLFSKSAFTGNGDEKFVKVRNKYCSFRPPSETLVDYLKRMHGAKNVSKHSRDEN